MEIKLCNFCQKQFDENDYINGGSIIDNLTGMDSCDMCADCYHKIMKVFLHHCKIKPFMSECDDDYDEDKDVSNE